MESQEDSFESEERSLTRHTLGGVFWLTVGRFLKAPINLLTVAILARLLSPSDFGILAIGTLVVSFTNVIVDGSFGMVLIQRRGINPALIGASLALSVALALLFSATIILGAPAIERAFDFPHLREVIIIFGAVVPITAVTMVTTALLQRDFQFRTLTRNAVASQLVYATLAIGLAFAGVGLWSLVWAQVASFTVEALLGFVAVRSRHKIEFSKSAIRDVGASGGMFTITKLLNWAANSVDRVVIGRFVGASQLGYYSRASTLLATAREVSGAGPIRVLFSSFAKIQHDPERLSRAYLRALSLSLIASMLVSAFIIVNAELIVRVLLGHKWLPTVPMMQILFAAFVAKTANVVADAIPLALGLSGQAALRQGIQLVLVSVGAALGAQVSVIGAVVGIASAYWVFYFICLLLVHQLLPIKWSETLRLHLKGLIVTLPPFGLALASWLFIRKDSLWMELIPAVLFGMAALVVLAIMPASIVSSDIVRARSHLWDRLSPYLRVVQTRRASKIDGL